MRTSALLVLLLAATPLIAHPGIGIVIDSRGNLFYTDLEQVWRIAPDGTKSVAVPRVHTHELVLDGADNLYGEHVWYEGEKTNRWGHYVWRRSLEGRVEKVIPPTAGFLTNYSFVRDRSGTMYWMDREHSQVMKRLPDGRIVPHARAAFRDVRWMAATPNGTLYIIDRADLLRVAPGGAVSALARNLSRPSVLHPDAGERHLLFGVWTDSHGDVYIADYAQARVLHRTAAGKITTAATSSWPWSPTGGVFARNGDLWVLESSITNQVRVRRVRLQR